MCPAVCRAPCEFGANAPCEGFLSRQLSFDALNRRRWRHDATLMKKYEIGAWSLIRGHGGRDGNVEGIHRMEGNAAVSKGAASWRLVDGIAGPDCDAY